MVDRFNLRRFLDAQDNESTYDRVLDELHGGRKTSHWIWYIYPQIAGLGRSPTSKYFAISSLDEAMGYLAHEILGPRLIECSDIIVGLEGRTAEEIFCPVDAEKLRSSMTLFLRAGPQFAAFQKVLDRYFGGVTDRAPNNFLITVDLKKLFGSCSRRRAVRARPRR